MRQQVRDALERTKPFPRFTVLSPAPRSCARELKVVKKWAQSLPTSAKPLLVLCKRARCFAVPQPKTPGFGLKPSRFLSEVLARDRLSRRQGDRVVVCGLWRDAAVVQRQDCRGAQRPIVDAQPGQQTAGRFAVGVRVVAQEPCRAREDGGVAGVGEA